MNLDLIRWIDRWVGIPACFFVSWVYRVAEWIRRWRNIETPPPETPQKALFIELSEMGSTVLAYPAMKYILKQYPGIALYFLIFEQNRFSVDMLGLIPKEHVLTIDPRSPVHFLASTAKTLMTVRKEKLDMVFDLELFSRFSALLSGLSGARIRVGYGRYHEEGLYRGSFMTHRVLYNPHLHISKNFMALVKSIEHGNEYPLLKEVIREEEMEAPQFQSDASDLQDLKERLAGVNPKIHEADLLVLVSPNAGDLLPIRAWPLQNYTALIKRILGRFNAVVVLIGLEGASRDAAEIIGCVGSERCVDFTSKTSFKDLLDLLNLADVLVTADGGPAHFAAQMPIKSIVLFGPETPVLYAPLGGNATSLSAELACSPCLSAHNHRKTTCADPKCMHAITVDEVFGAVVEAIAAPETLV
jgi:ADP-heptose:LPS heptosyltransferase